MINIIYNIQDINKHALINKGHLWMVDFKHQNNEKNSYTHVR